MLIESLMLAVLGGGCGILLARWATGLLVVYMSAGPNHIVLNLSPNLRLLLFTGGFDADRYSVRLGSGVTRHANRSSTRSERCGGAVSMRDRFRTGRMLTVAQVALSLVLVFGAGLFVRSLHNLSGGARSAGENTLILHVEPRGNETRPRHELDRVYQDLIRRVEEIPGVRSVAWRR
jgi:hypothetical protein